MTFLDPASETESIRVSPPKRKPVPRLTELELDDWQNPVAPDPVPQKVSTVKRKAVPYHILDGLALSDPSTISSSLGQTYLLHPSPLVCSS